MDKIKFTECVKLRDATITKAKMFKNSVFRNCTFDFTIEDGFFKSCNFNNCTFLGHSVDNLLFARCTFNKSFFVGFDDQRIKYYECFDRTQKKRVHTCKGGLRKHVEQIR